MVHLFNHFLFIYLLIYCSGLVGTFFFPPPQCLYSTEPQKTGKVCVFCFFQNPLHALRPYSVLCQCFAWCIFASLLFAGSGNEDWVILKESSLRFHITVSAPDLRNTLSYHAHELCLMTARCAIKLGKSASQSKAAQNQKSSDYCGICV